MRSSRRHPRSGIARGVLWVDNGLLHERGDDSGIFRQSFESEMHVVLGPVEILRPGSKSLLQRLGGIEEMKIVGGGHFLHRGADEIVPYAARSIRFQMLKMRM